MTLISSDIHAFCEALQRSPVACSSDGRWTTICPLRQRLQKLIGIDKNRLIKVAQVYLQCLDHLERSSARGTKPRQDLLAYIKAAAILRKSLKETKSKHAKQWSNLLKNRVVSLQTRMRMCYKTKAVQTVADQVEKLAVEWKKNCYLKSRKDLSPLEKDRIKKVQSNGAFAKLLTKDSELQARFFDWMLRDEIDPEPFMSFPFNCQQLTDVRLSQRIGFYGGEDLKLKTVQVSGQVIGLDLTLPMSGQEVSLLDKEYVVEFEKGYKQTIGEVIESFANRKNEMTNLEYLQGGISNWNSKRLASFNPATGKYDCVDMQVDDWWEKLPVVEELTVKEAVERYNIELDGVQWAFAVRAARQEESDSPIGVHGWLQIAIPIEGKYRILDFGKYIEEYPKTWYEYIDSVTNTLSGVVAYPDEATFAQDRQHAWHATCAGRDEGVELMDAIKRDVEEVGKDNFPFQLLAENCMKWAWLRANERVGDDRMPPSVANMNFLTLKPSGMLGKVFQLIHYLPIKLQRFILTFFVTLLGAWRGKKVVDRDGTARRISLLANLPWKEGGEFYCPCQLYH